MAESEFFPVRDLISKVDGDKKSLSTANHVMTKSGVWVPQKGAEDGSMYTKDSESKQGLNTEPKPVGSDGETYLEYNVTTQETKVFHYIRHAWREL